MYRCTIVTVATYPHIHTSTHPDVYVHARRVGDVRRSRFVATHPIQHYTSNAHLFLYYVFNIEYNEYNDNNNISAMNNSYI